MSQTHAIALVTKKSSVHDIYTYIVKQFEIMQLRAMAINLQQTPVEIK